MAGKKIIYDSVRRTWTRKPETQVVSSKKKYSRKRDKEVLRRAKGLSGDDGSFDFVRRLA